MKANNMKSDQTAPIEQSDQGLYCTQYYMQYRLPGNISRRDEQTAKVVTSMLILVNSIQHHQWIPAHARKRAHKRSIFAYVQ